MMIDQEKDWLTQEIRYESKISAWDLDEPKKVRKSHEDNCPREKVAIEHVKVHNSYKREVAEDEQTANIKARQIKAASLVTSLFFVIAFLIVIANIFFG